MHTPSKPLGAFQLFSNPFRAISAAEISASFASTTLGIGAARIATGRSSSSTI